MPRSGHATRNRILDAAEALILNFGYGGTSIDMILEKAGITKGTFFYHFPTKSDLAHALVHRFDEHDSATLAATTERSARLSRDPLQQLLIFAGLMEEQAEQIAEPYPGCLFAAYCYEHGLFDEEVHALITRGMNRWRGAMLQKLEAAAAQYPPRIDVDLTDVADMITTLFEGGFVMTRTLRDPTVLTRQVRLYRHFLEMLFGVEPAEATNGRGQKRKRQPRPQAN